MYYFLLYILAAGVIYSGLSSPCLAQSSTPLMGARGQALGNATACLSDEWSMLNNVAGLARRSGAAIGVSYDAVPAVHAFSKMGVTIARPGNVACGVALYRFGDALYNEQIIAAGAATKWNHTSLGMKLNYIRYTADGMGGKSLWSVSLGGITALTPWLTVGAHIANVNQPWLSKQFDERLPTTLTAGVMFTLTPRAIVVTEIEQRINDKATGRLGMEVSVHKKVRARLGLHINPQALSGGLGFQLRHFDLDYSMLYVQTLGSRHQATFTYRLQRKKRSNNTSKTADDAKTNDATK